MSYKDYKCLPEGNHVLIGDRKQILNSGPRNEIEGIWSKDHDDDIRVVSALTYSRVGENQNRITSCNGRIILRNTAFIPLCIVSRASVLFHLIFKNNL